MTACAVEGYSLGCSGWAGLLSRRSGSRRMGSLSVSGRGCGRRLVAGFAVGGRRAMTGARGGGAGGRSTWGPRRHLWRQTRRGSSASGTGWLSHVCLGRGTARGSRGSSSSRWRGWRRAARRRRCANSCACRGTRSGGSSSASSSMSAPGRATRSTDSGGSGSTNSPIGSGSATSPSLLTTTQGCWSGPRKAATRRQSPGSSPSSGLERSAGIELVYNDMGEWITRAVAERCPQATLCLDPFHVVALASDALDEVRREVWNEAKTFGRQRRRPLAQRRPLGFVEATRTIDRAAAGEARDDRARQPPGLLPRLPPQRGTPPRLPERARRRRRSPRGLARLGKTLPDPELHQARQDNHREQAGDRRDAHPSDSRTPESKRSTPLSG